MRQWLDTARFLFWAQGTVYLALALLAFFHPRPKPDEWMFAAGYTCGGAACWLGAYAWRRSFGWSKLAVAVGSLAALPALPLGLLAGSLGLYWCLSGRAQAALATPAADEPAQREPVYQSKPGDATMPWVQKAFPLVWFITWVVSLWLAAKFGRSLGLPKDAALNGMMVIAVGMFVSIFVHELGHALAAMAMGMRVKLFQVGPFRGEQMGGRWKLKFEWAGLIGFGGGVASVPVHMRNLRERMLVEIAAGPLASLLAGWAALSILLAVPGSGWEAWWKVPAAVMAISLHAAVMNLVPMGEVDGFSDGAALMQLLRGGQFAEYRAAMKLVGSTTVTDTRPRDLDPQALAEGMKAGLETGHQAGVLQMIQLVCAVDREDHLRAKEHLERGLERIPAPDQAPDAECAAELALYLAYLDGHAGRASGWLAASEALAERNGESLAESFDYWFSVAAVRKAEGCLADAEVAFAKASELSARKPQAGIYEYERELVVRVRDTDWVQPLSQN